MIHIGNTKSHTYNNFTVYLIQNMVTHRFVLAIKDKGKIDSSQTTTNYNKVQDVCIICSMYHAWIVMYY